MSREQRFEVLKFWIESREMSIWAQKGRIVHIIQHYNDLVVLFLVHEAAVDVEAWMRRFVDEGLRIQISDK